MVEHPHYLATESPKLNHTGGQVSLFPRFETWQCPSVDNKLTFISVETTLPNNRHVHLRTLLPQYFKIRDVTEKWPPRHHGVCGDVLELSWWRLPAPVATNSSAPINKTDTKYDTCDNV